MRLSRVDLPTFGRPRGGTAPDVPPCPAGPLPDPSTAFRPLNGFLPPLPAATGGVRRPPSPPLSSSSRSPFLPCRPKALLKRGKSGNGAAPPRRGDGTAEGARGASGTTPAAGFSHRIRRPGPPPLSPPRSGR